MLNLFSKRNRVTSKSPAAYSAPVSSSRKQAVSSRPTSSPSNSAAGLAADAFQPPFHHLLDGSKVAIVASLPSRLSEYSNIVQVAQCFRIVQSWL